jgi:hypothetical protein
MAQIGASTMSNAIRSDGRANPADARMLGGIAQSQREGYFEPPSRSKICLGHGPLQQGLCWANPGGLNRLRIFSSMQAHRSKTCVCSVWASSARNLSSVSVASESVLAVDTKSERFRPSAILARIHFLKSKFRIAPTARGCKCEVRDRFDCRGLFTGRGGLLLQRPSSYFAAMREGRVIRHAKFTF